MQGAFPSYENKLKIIFRHLLRGLEGCVKFLWINLQPLNYTCKQKIKKT